VNKTILALTIAAVTASAWAESVDVRTRPHFDRTFNSYKDAFVYKVYLKSKGTAPETTIDQVRDIIRLTYDVSGGMHQIVYLVGWQYDGHDSKYPAWHETGAHCASSLSDDPRESIRKLMRESRQYNADVSFHINMNDAYTSSPLWKTYEEKDLLRRMEDGSVYVGDDWGGERCRIISHVREWEAGLAQKRILDLLELYPELRDGGTTIFTVGADVLGGPQSRQNACFRFILIAGRPEVAPYRDCPGFCVNHCGSLGADGGRLKGEPRA